MFAIQMIVAMCELTQSRLPTPFSYCIKDDQDVINSLALSLGRCRYTTFPSASAFADNTTIPWLFIPADRVGRRTRIRKGRLEVEHSAFRYGMHVGEHPA
jgi:hypothetical protein